MNRAALNFLTTPAGQALLGELHDADVAEQNLLPLLSRLRARFGPTEAAAALELTQLRRHAAAKFSLAQQMYFARDALEQASGEAVSAHRARRFAPHPRVLDLGCGIGGDMVQLARASHVVAVDQDGLRVRMAQLNARAYDVAARVSLAQADLAALALPAGWPFFLDPGRRRAGGARVFSIFQYTPPLTILPHLLERNPDAAVKVSPGVAYDELATLGLAYELEFISEAGTCKEGVLWLGALRPGVARRATLLPGGLTLTSAEPASDVPVRTPGQYLYDPDPAIVRAHLVEQLAVRHGWAKIDSQIAYLTSDQAVQSPFARAFRIDEVHPFNLKRLRERLRALGVGEITVMKRGSAVEPEALAKRLKLRGSAQRIVFLTRTLGKPSMLIGKRVF